MLCRTREFNAWWFETGTPTFLVDTLFRRKVSTVALDDVLGSDALLSAFTWTTSASRRCCFRPAT